MEQSTIETAEKIKVRREWLGAPDSTFGNPTVWLFALSAAVSAVSSWAYLVGAAPWPVTLVLNGVAFYWGFTVMHESMHGIAHRNRAANRCMGQVCGLLLTISLPLFRGAHYEHHSHTNDVERDPDLFVAQVPPWLVPFAGLGVVWEYRRHFYGRRLWRGRSDLGEALGVEAILAAVTVVAIATGNAMVLFTLWFGPAVLAVMLLVSAFDYLPHYPYESSERYLDTRVSPGRVGNALLLGQNYHLVHHLWTTIPWYRYSGVFAEIKPELVRRGATIAPMFPVAWLRDAPQTRLRRASQGG